MLRTAGPLALAALLLGPTATAGDTTSDPHALNQPPKLYRAKKLRGQAQEAYKKVEESVRRIQAGEKLPATTLADIQQALEECVLLYERCLKQEWNDDDNQAQAAIVRVWFKIKEQLPEPKAPEDPEAKAKFQKQMKAAARKRSSAARKMVMSLCGGRKYTKLLPRCRRCDGRGVLKSAFGEKTKCPVCEGLKIQSSRKEILKAHWFPYSPLYRENIRNAVSVERMLRTAHINAFPLGPDIRSCKILDVKDEGRFVTVKVRLKQLAPGAKSTETAETAYRVFSVGKVLYLWNSTADRNIVPVEDEK